MQITLLILTFVTLLIFATLLVFLIKEIKNKNIKSKEIPLVFLTLVYLIFTIILFLWTTNILQFNISDLLIIFSIILTLQTISLITIMYELKKNKKIFYTIIPFITLIPLILYNLKLIHLTIPLSLLTILLLFLNIINTNEKATRYLIFYSTTSLILYVLAINWQNLITTLTIISTILFLVFINHFLKFLKFNSWRYLHHIKQSSESPLIHFLKHFIFIVIITNFMFIGTISIHEFGHLVTSSQSNCQETKIIYELKGFPHTEIKCNDITRQNQWILGGILLPFIIAALLFLGGGKFIKELSAQMVGFNLMISYLDIISLGFSKTIATFSLISGVALSIFSLALLARSRIE